MGRKGPLLGQTLPRELKKVRCLNLFFFLPLFESKWSNMFPKSNPYLLFYVKMYVCDLFRSWEFALILLPILF